MSENEIREKINAAIEKTKRSISDYREQSQPISPDDSIGRVSRMDAINNKTVTEASLRQAEGKLNNLERVLSQLGTADFGVCISCRNPIPIERIVFRPESLYCVRCAR